MLVGLGLEWNAMNNNTEVWKKIKGFNYEVSTYGRVRNIKNIKVLKQSVGTGGYYQICLCNNGKQHTKKVHKLVANAFLKGLHKGLQVNHKDENKLNNNLTNLEYLTPKENSNYGTRNMRMSVSLGKRVRVFYKDGKTKDYLTIRQAAKDNKIDQSSICACLKGKHKSVGGLKFKYL